MGKSIKGQKSDIAKPMREAGRALAEPAFFAAGAYVLQFAPVRYAAVGLGTLTEYSRTKDPLEAGLYGFATGLSFRIGEQIGEAGKMATKDYKSGLGEMARNVFISEKFVNRKTYIEQNRGNPEAIAEAERLTSEFMNRQEAETRQMKIRELMEAGDLKNVNRPQGTGLDYIQVQLGKASFRGGETVYFDQSGAFGGELSIVRKQGLDIGIISRGRILGRDLVAWYNVFPKAAEIPVIAPQEQAIPTTSRNVVLTSQGEAPPMRATAKVTTAKEMLTSATRRAYSPILPRSEGGVISNKRKTSQDLRNEMSQSFKIKEAQKFRIGEAQKFKVSQAQKMRIEQAQKLRMEEAQKFRIGEIQELRLMEAQKFKLEQAQKFRIGQAQKFRVGLSNKFRVETAQKTRMGNVQIPFLAGRGNAKKISSRKIRYPKVKKGWSSDITGMTYKIGGKGLEGLSPRYNKSRGR